MPFIKISGLTTATAVSATNQFEINQNGASRSLEVSVLDSYIKQSSPLPVVVSVNSASAAVRITQLGGGNALLVEDSANPDATPFVVNASGQVLIGRATAPFGTTQLGIERQTDDTQAPPQDFLKNRAGATVVTGDGTGQLRFWGFDGTSNQQNAGITAIAEGTIATGDVPGRLVFSTRAQSAASVSERMRIDNAGNVGIGTTNPTARLNVVDATSQDALRITQTGAGNALVVEDSANPDATPLVVNADGRLVSGHTVPITGIAGLTPRIQVAASDAGGSFFGASRWDNSANAGGMDFLKSRGASVGTNGIVQSGDTLAQIRFAGDDGAAFLQAASIQAAVDGTPGTNDMPGRLMFSTTADGASSPTERMRITNAGNVGIGTTTPVNRLQVNGSFGRGAPVTKTGNFTLADTENWLICNGAGTITVTFPAASSWTGREVMIKTIAAQTVISASSNVVPLAGGAAGTAILAASAGAWATLVSDGTNWVIMQA